MSIFVIAEAGVNHNGSVNTALSLVEVAADAGADAVKFQTFVANRVASATSPKARYQDATVGADRKQLEMLRELELDVKAHRELAARSAELGLEFLSSPFDRRSASFLADEIGVTRMKVPSGEITNGPLLLHVAETGLPVILSTGMSNLDEIEQALGVLAYGYTRAADRRPSRDAFRDVYASEFGREALERNVTILQCTSSYPCPVEEANLRVLDTLRQAFGLPVGLSDHTRGSEVPVAAVGRGAVVIEKHFTLDRSMEGPDHAASLEPEELGYMIDGIRTAARGLGTAVKQPTPSERPNREVARRSLTAARTIEAGEAFTEENVTVKRPGSGLSPMRYWEILGETADRDYEPDELLT